MDNTVNRNRNSGAYLGAAILIVIGVAALIGNLGGGKYVGESIVLAVGLAFLTAYAMTRLYGYLVPGGILTGFGAGVLVASLMSAGDAGPYAVIGGSLGFLLIFAVDVIVAHQTIRWWPVVPGGIMLLVGTSALSDNLGWTRLYDIWGPVLLIALGVLILVTRARQPRR